jgi:hypothetical protein
MVAEVKKYKNGSSIIKIDLKNIDFFDSEDYIIKNIENGFSISKPNLSYLGKSYRAVRKKDNYITISLVKDIGAGNYFLDEESDEDILYFVNKDYL